MPVCPNCGTPVSSNAAKIIAWCVGIFMVVGIGLPMMAVMALAAIAAIGSSEHSQSKVAERDGTHHHAEQGHEHGHGHTPLTLESPEAK